ncbi:MAG: 30S ribosomal protein S17 [Candidatus Paceibacterota bacterium]
MATKDKTKKNIEVGIPRKLNGVVVSDKMKDTVVVEVSRFVKHPKYDKYISTHKKYKAHNPGNTNKVGDKVTIVECAPISRDKSFKII